MRDTIAAIATPHGNSGIGIVRLSGAQAREIAQTLIGRRLRPRHAHFANFFDECGETIDSGIVLWFPAPQSYTGEDIVELQGHGNPLVQDRLLRRVQALGARAARPGEFSERAFLEGRMDLAQAEAVADLIAAGSEAAARAAQRSLEGEFSRRVQALLQALIETRLHVEAAIDFPEEDIDFLSDGAVDQRIQAVRDAHALLLVAAERGQRLRDGRVVVIIGRPNAGKSSLLNALAGSDRAIVTDIAGTTRDVLREEIRLGPMALTLIDTAGLRDSDDAIETEGVRRARAELTRADHAILVIDDVVGEDIDALRSECPPGLPRTLVFNKIDLSKRAHSVREHAVRTANPVSHDNSEETRVCVSVKTGEGMPVLIAHLQSLAAEGSELEGTFSARTRHVDALRRCGLHIDRAHNRLIDERAGELVAEELRLAQQALSEITGEYTPDDLLSAIFGSFCIGK
jgi:tRNA modification GTPase